MNKLIQFTVTTVDSGDMIVFDCKVGKDSLLDCELVLESLVRIVELCASLVQSLVVP